MLRKSIFKLFQNRNKDDLHDSQFAKDSLEQIQIPRHLAVIMDGNGRCGRFLMNLMMAAGGYPWTVVPLAKRDEYMDALEQASVGQNIVPFTRFIAGLAANQ